MESTGQLVHPSPCRKVLETIAGRWEHATPDMMQIRKENRSKILYFITLICSLLLLDACATSPEPDQGGSSANETGKSAVDSDKVQNAQAAESAVYIVKRGDTLHAIALKTTGTYSDWRHIAEHNQIADPNKLHVGQKIVIPPGLNQTGTKSDDSDPYPPTQPRGWLLVRGTNYPREINMEPDPASDILTQVWPGTHLYYTERIDSWYKVITEKGYGYVNPEYVHQPQ
ncbi:MAG: LysM peptidoglycan-binding domain-containing protein [Gammaproteobacteria bacterium]|nr:LysM peptidoglycan-binding domain-containing protein [Gammaproteobacteria bacterium]